MLFSYRKLEVFVASLAWLVAFANSRRIGTELLAHREKIEVTRCGLTILAFSGADGSCASPSVWARVSRIFAENALRDETRYGGARWIRTLGTGCPARPE